MSNQTVIPAPPSPEAEAFAKGFVNLLQPRLGAEVAFVTDEFFAPAARIMDPAPPVFRGLGEYHYWRHVPRPHAAHGGRPGHSSHGGKLDDERGRPDLDL